MGSSLFDRTTLLLEATLDRQALRHRLIVRNLANIDTPHYRGTGLEFQKQLRKALEGGVLPTRMARTNPRHMPYTEPKPFDQAQPVYKDTGPVHLDIEMSRLAENNIMFDAMVKLLGRKFADLRAAIAERGGK